MCSLASGHSPQFLDCGASCPSNKPSPRPLANLSLLCPLSWAISLSPLWNHLPLVALGPVPVQGLRTLAGVSLGGLGLERSRWGPSGCEAQGPGQGQGTNFNQDPFPGASLQKGEKLGVKQLIIPKETEKVVCLSRYLWYRSPEPLSWLHCLSGKPLLQQSDGKPGPGLWLAVFINRQEFFKWLVH